MNAERDVESVNKLMEHANATTVSQNVRAVEGDEEFGNTGRRRTKHPTG